MAKALLANGRITTTEAKAKTLRGVVEPLITLALKNDLHARRMAYKELGDHKLVQKLFDEIGPQYKDGGGGYTRVVKLALPRKGDAAPLAVIALRVPGEKASSAPKKKQAVKPAAPAAKPAPEAPAPAAPPAPEAAEPAPEA
jgi:large subunit ribosomal protein L17